MQLHALKLQCLALTLLIAARPTISVACDLARQSEGRVAAVIDARTLRLDDGRDIHLTGIAPLSADHAPVATSLLASLVVGRVVILHGNSDAPDRYGRQPALLRLDADGPSVQAMLAAQGGALADGGWDDVCAGDIREAEADARHQRLGIWAHADVIKNAESRGELLAGIGRFAVVEGRVLSVRQANSVTYVNFGRRWTQDFAVTISSKVLARFEAAGLKPGAFEGKSLRVRGIVEQRGGPNGGPRIEVVRPGQIEIVGADRSAGASE